MLTGRCGASVAGAASRTTTKTSSHEAAEPTASATKPARHEKVIGALGGHVGDPREVDGDAVGAAVLTALDGGDAHADRYL